MLNIKKNKVLSQLIALTFAFNTIAPIAYASETEDATAITTPKTGISLTSASSDILNRIATTQASTFKSKKYNISDNEINNLMNIPLSTDEEESYLTQEEKDYNNLQLLIAKGLNTAEARATALKKLQDIENLSKTDKSVGGLTTAEQYVKSLLENYDDIESRSSINDTIGSAITTTDNAVLAYRTILKVAKAERLACRNDALSAKAKADKGETLVEGTNTDPDKCELSAKGKEAAQMLTYISNQQVNQTTDSKKTTNATNTNTSSSGERKCDNPATPTVALNDNTKCCTSQQPFYNSTTGKCVASLATNTNSSSSSSNDDDSNSDALLAQFLLSQQQNCKNTDDLVMNIMNRCTLPTGGTVHPTKEETSLPSKPVKGSKKTTDGKTEDKTTINGNSEANSAVMNRISDIKIEFNEKNRDDKGYYVHVNDSSSEYQLTVTLEEKATNDKENQNPLLVKIYATQYIGEDENNATPYRFTQTTKSGVPITVVYPENMKPTNNANGHFIKKVLGTDEFYTLAITITDGTYESSPFYVRYKIVDTGAKILDNNKDQTSGEVSIIEQQSKNYFTETTGNASLDVTGAKYENGICKLSVEGSLVTSDSENTQKIPASEYELDSVNEADCIKLNEDAKNNKLHMATNNAQIIDILKDGTVILKSDSDILPAFSIDGGDNYLDTNDYLTSTASSEETNFSISNGVPFGKLNNKDVVYMDGSLKVKTDDNTFEDITSEQLSEMLHEKVPEGAYADFDYNSTGEILINIKNEDGEVLKTITTPEMAKKTIKQVQKHGLHNDVAKSIDRVVTNIKNATVKMLGGSVIAEATSTKVKETFNNIKKINASNTKNTEVSKTAPATIDVPKK